MRILSMALALVAAACTDDKDGSDEGEGEEEIVGVPALGSQSHDPAAVQIDVVGTEDDGLDVPRDLEFNPLTGELWVINRTDDSVSIFFDAGTDEQESEHIIDDFALHFMEEPSSLAFGAALFEGSDAPNFATCQESQNTYNNQTDPNNFMGPALWTSDLELFGEGNPEAIQDIDYNLGSHLDMLHESPLCMGIAWDTDNVYWVFDGFHDAIVRYDFQEDHDVGYDDHSDGIIARYVEGEVERVADVPSHMILDHETGLLYIADTGNNRIAVLDTATGEEGDNLPKMEPGTEHYEMVDAEMWTLIEGEDFGLEAPSGVALVDGVLLVTDNTTATIHAFNLDGEEVDSLTLDVDEGGLMGIEARGLDDIWVVDAEANEVLRLQP